MRPEISLDVDVVPEPRQNGRRIMIQRKYRLLAAASLFALTTPTAKLTALGAAVQDSSED
jgi:hypothetical protein